MFFWDCRPFFLFRGGQHPLLPTPIEAQAPVTAQRLLAENPQICHVPWVYLKPTKIMQKTPVGWFIEGNIILPRFHNLLIRPYLLWLGFVLGVCFIFYHGKSPSFGDFFQPPEANLRSVSVASRNTSILLQIYSAWAPETSMKKRCAAQVAQLHSGWWFQIFFIFTPTWGNDPI